MLMFHMCYMILSILSIYIIKMLMTKNNNQHCECKAPVTMLILPKVASQSQTTHAQKHKQNMQ